MYFGVIPPMDLKLTILHLHFDILNGYEISKWIQDFDFSEDRGGFEYLTKSSAVYLSNIEGNSVDLIHEINKDQFKPGKGIEEIEDLIEAYGFAQNNPLNENHSLNCHRIFSRTLLIRINEENTELNRLVFLENPD